MKITAIKSHLVHAGECTFEELIAESLTTIEEKSVVAVSSKVVALCQNRVVDKSTTTKSELIKQEADFYTSESFNRYGFHFTITNNTFISSAGIDESNGDNYFVLWPKNPQQVANELRTFLSKRFGLKDVGVIVTDSTSMPPMRLGTMGIMLAHSGFSAVNQLIGKEDLFGRLFMIEKAAIGSGLAAAANVVMGEGTEQTPLAVISDVPFVDFQRRNPTKLELKSVYISPEDDLYAPFMRLAPWEKGGAHARS